MTAGLPLVQSEESPRSRREHCTFKLEEWKITNHSQNSQGKWDLACIFFLLLLCQGLMYRSFHSSLLCCWANLELLILLLPLSRCWVTLSLYCCVEQGIIQIREALYQLYPYLFICIFMAFNFPSLSCGTISVELGPCDCWIEPVLPFFQHSLPGISLLIFLIGAMLAWDIVICLINELDNNQPHGL